MFLGGYIHALACLPSFFISFLINAIYAETMPRPEFEKLDFVMYPLCHYLRINRNTTKEIKLRRQNRTLWTRYFALTYFVVVRDLTNYDAVVIESASFMDEF